jgi:3-deoxy-manno-octulosonate cytidylyltransferase (CMP-KDO synthetase)
LKALILIPARYQSSRFPGKPLVEILGKSMIERVYQQALSSGFDTWVVTDDKRISDHLDQRKINNKRVDDDVPSGSERIALAYQRFFSDRNYDYVVNFQGDEPIFPGSELIRLVEFHSQTSFDITTLVKKRQQTEIDFTNPNCVKAIVGENHQAFYFTRQAAPYCRDENHIDTATWHQHVGIYCYRPNVLIDFLNLKPTRLENLEKLEQLRALEHGLTIGALETTYTSMGVDCPEDVSKIIEVLSE